MEGRRVTTAWWLLVAWFTFDAGFLCGCAWVASHQVSRKDYRNVLKLLHEAQGREQEDAIMIVRLTKALERSTSRVLAATRLLDRATKHPKTNERFDWKAGTGVA